MSENANLKIWDQVKTVPKEAQKTITGGRLNGMTDISPMWRYHKMTELFGPVGIGWKFEITRQWIEEGADNQRCAFVNINLWYKVDGEWSHPVVGTGGSMLVAKERSGLHTSDEAFKMALTDALSTAMKLLGVGAMIYAGGKDYSKYTRPADDGKLLMPGQIKHIEGLLKEHGKPLDKVLAWLGVESLNEVPAKEYERIVAAIKNTVNGAAK